MIIHLNLLAATIRLLFLMLIDYTLDLTPPFSPYPVYLSEEREDKEIALKFPLVLA